MKKSEVFLLIRLLTVYSLSAIVPGFLLVGFLDGWPMAFLILKIIGGCYLIVILVILYSHIASRKLRNGPLVTGTIVSAERTISDDQSWLKLTVEFYTEKKSQVTASTKIPIFQLEWEESAYQPGGSCLLRYHPENPEEILIETEAEETEDNTVELPNTLSTIKMNSTYLECGARFYREKEEITAFGIFTFVGCFVFLYFPIMEILKWPTILEHEQGRVLFFIIASFAVLIPTMLILWFTGLRKEIFRFTHYPIRFNRKTQMVHVFQPDGRVMNGSWGKLNFYSVFLENPDEMPEVSGTSLLQSGKQMQFIQRYMESGPAEVLPLMDHVLDDHVEQSDRREGFIHGFKMISSNSGRLRTIVFFPIVLLYAIWCWIVMRTCNKPEWPAEIEAECAIEPDDPYLVDANHLPEGVEAVTRFKGNEIFRIVRWRSGISAICIGIFAILFALTFQGQPV
ncbi:MAG: DUF3592 domain-containing protein [Betaproteobacteria bacterium]|nr:DUF3592 domain-containing protein [Betaproteobacteria bacterium]